MGWKLAWKPHINSFGPYAFRARTNVEGAAFVATLLIYFSGHRERTEERNTAELGRLLTVL